MSASPAWTPAPRPGIIPLHPLGFGTLLGRSFAALRHNPAVLFGFALGVQALAYLILIIGVGGIGWLTFTRLDTLRQGTDEFDAVFTGSALITGLAAFVLGLHSLLGQRGIPIGAITLMFIANPISAATQPAQFLVGPWGAIGQWFVPGASATLLRDLSYFPGAESLGFTWAVVSVWALAGIALTIVGGNFRKTHTVVDATPAGLEPVAA